MDKAANEDAELHAAEGAFYALIGRLGDRDLQIAAELDSAAGAWLKAWVRLAWSDGYTAGTQAATSQRGQP
jgi:hypothetical protein